MGAGPRSRGRRRRARRALGPTARRPRSPHRCPGDARAGGGSRGGRRALRPRADARSLPARPARAGARPAAREAVSARFRPLRRLDRPVRGVSRNRAPAASTSLLPPAARSGTFPLRRPRPLGRPPALALVRNRTMVRPRARQGDEAALHCAAAPRIRVVGAPSLPSSVSSVSITRVVVKNPYAAIPSLHGGYAFLVFLFVALLLWKTRWRWLIPIAALYPLVQSFAVVYTANHYIVDLLIGFAYAAAAVFGVRWFWRRRGWPE